MGRQAGREVKQLLFTAGLLSSKPHGNSSSIAAVIQGVTPPLLSFSLHPIFCSFTSQQTGSNWQWFHDLAGCYTPKQQQKTTTRKQNTHTKQNKNVVGCPHYPEAQEFGLRLIPCTAILQSHTSTGHLVPSEQNSFLSVKREAIPVDSVTHRLKFTILQKMIYRL